MTFVRVMNELAGGTLSELCLGDVGQGRKRALLSMRRGKGGSGRGASIMRSGCTRYVRGAMSVLDLKS